MKDESVRYRKRKGKVNLGAKRLNTIIKEMPYDKDYKIDVSEWEEPKTWPQIKFFHGPVLDAYCEYSGCEWKHAKKTLKKHFGVNGITKDTITGKQEPDIRSLADYSKQEMQTFFDRLLNFFEYQCGMVVDSETRKRFKFNEQTGEREEF